MAKIETRASLVERLRLAKIGPDVSEASDGIGLGETLNELLLRAQPNIRQPLMRDRGSIWSVDTTSFTLNVR